MEKTNRELLIEGISSRLPYGIKVQVLAWSKENREIKVPLKVYSIDTDGYVYFESNEYNVDCVDAEDCLLYLRPISSMTEEEYDQLYIDSRVKEDSIDILDALANDLDAIYWLYAHHFDINLIERGLAIEAPDDMYK